MGDTCCSERFVQLRSIRWAYVGALREYSMGASRHDVTLGAYLAELHNAVGARCECLDGGSCGMLPGELGGPAESGWRADGRGGRRLARGGKDSRRRMAGGEESKLATARALTPESAVSTLGEMLDLGTVDPKELYAAMDWLVERQAAIEQRLARRHLQEHTLVLYDLTASYVEGTHCELARRGHSRDRKKGTLQIVFGLLCTATGCPVAVEVFEGSTSDPNTVAAQVDKIRSRFGLHRVVLVGDRGMLAAARIREDLAGVDGLRWITTLRAPTIRKLVAAGTVSASLFDEHDLAEVTSEEFPGERLIVCRNPLLAAERQRKRQELLAATEKELEPIVAATRRPKNPLRGAAAIGVRVGKVINHYKVAKHFVTTITDDLGYPFNRSIPTPISTGGSPVAAPSSAGAHARVAVLAGLSGGDGW